MPYIGNTIRAADDYRLIDDISSSFNGSTTSFALQVAGSSPVPFPKSPQQVLISVNGVIQEPDPTGSSGFNLVGTNIVFSSAPTNGHAFFGIIYATADYLNAGGNFPSGSLGAPSFTFIGDENTGLYRKSGGSVGFVSDATEIANFDSNGITISSGNLILGDSAGASSDRVVLGASSDLSIYHDGSNSFVDNNTNDLVIRCDGDDLKLLAEDDIVLRDNDDSTNFIQCINGGAVELYHNGSKKLETTSTGATVTGGINATGLSTFSASGSALRLSDNSILRLGNDDSDFFLFHDAGSNGYISTGAGKVLRITTDDFRVFGAGNTEQIIRGEKNGAVNLFYDNVSQIETIATGFKSIASGNRRITIGSTNASGAMLVLDGDSDGDGSGNDYAFIQHNTSGELQIENYKSAAIRFATGGTDRYKIDASGHLLPAADSTYNIGSNSVRVANGYFDTLYGDGSNLTGITTAISSIAGDANNRVIVSDGDGTATCSNQFVFDGNKLQLLGTNNSRAFEVNPGSNAGSMVIDRNGFITSMIRASDGGSNVGGSSGGGSRLHLAKTSINFDTFPHVSNIGDSVTYTTRASIDTSGNFVPGANNSYSLGTSSLRWSNLFVNDIKMSNVGSQNDVDGTWGDYTIQEGYEDLFLINHRTGKKFKFNLTEIG